MSFAWRVILQAPMFLVRLFSIMLKCYIFTKSEWYSVQLFTKMNNWLSIFILNYFVFWLLFHFEVYSILLDILLYTLTYVGSVLMLEWCVIILHQGKKSSFFSSIRWIMDVSKYFSYWYQIIIILKCRM